MTPEEQAALDRLRELSGNQRRVAESSLRVRARSCFERYNERRRAGYEAAAAMWYEEALACEAVADLLRAL